MVARTLLALFVIAVALVASPLSAQDKPILAVLDLKTDQVSDSEMKTIISLLSSALFDTGRYTVIDVAERETLLKEQEFSTQDCTDERCQLEIGKLLAAEYVVVGRLGKVGAKYVLSVKLLETGSSRAVGTADGTYAALDQVLGDLSRVAGKLSGVGAKRQVSARKVAGGVCLAAAAGCAAGAVVLIVSGVQQLNGPAAAAYEAYLAAPDGSTEFVSLYEAYVAAFNGFRVRTGVGIGLGAGTLGFAAAGIALLALQAKAGSTPVAVVVGAEGRGVHLGLRLRY